MYILYVQHGALQHVFINSKAIYDSFVSEDLYNVTSKLGIPIKIMRIENSDKYLSDTFRI